MSKSMIGLKAKLVLTIAFSWAVSWNIGPALACDGTPELLGPRLRFNPPSFLEASSIKVTLSPHLIQFSYIITNISDQDWTGRLEFRLPAKALVNGDVWYPDESFQDLAVEVNGSKLDYQRQVEAIFLGREVTGEILAAGADPQWVQWAVDEHEKVDLSKENIKAYQDLHAQGICGFPTEPDLEDPEGYICFPNWETLNTYWWEQTFPAETATVVTYSYRPRPGWDIAKVGEKYDVTPFMPESGYPTVNDLMEAAGLAFELVAGFLPPETGSYAVEWFTLPLGLDDIPWDGPVGEFIFELKHQQEPGTQEYQPHLYKAMATTIALKGEVYRGRPGMKVRVEDIIFTRPPLVLAFFHYSNN